MSCKSSSYCVVLHQLKSVAMNIDHVVRSEDKKVYVLLIRLRVVVFAHFNESLQERILLLEELEDLMNFIWLLYQTPHHCSKAWL